MNFVSILGGSAPFLIGVLLVIATRRELALGWRSRRWPHTTGRMCDLGIQEGTQLSTATDGTFAPVGQPYREVYLIYNYVVEGKEYRSAHLSASNEAAYERHYEEGAVLTVYYDPIDPSVSVLEPGVTGRLWVGPGFLFLGGAGLLACLVFWR